ncbi:hypothetical protein [Streptomyces sp. NPDC088752]|uniref:hypothetical protein n=1 Tax=Streptomyces sp. NPDC088752 TaxID=3154963 RepID=UPI0034136938
MTTTHGENTAPSPDDFEALLDASSLGTEHICRVREQIPDRIRERLHDAVAQHSTPMSDPTCSLDRSRSGSLADEARQLWSWSPATRMELRSTVLEIVRTFAEATLDADALAEALDAGWLQGAGRWAHALRRDLSYGLARVHALAHGNDRLGPMTRAMVDSFSYKLPANTVHACQEVLRLAGDLHLVHEALTEIVSDFVDSDLRSTDLEWVPLEGVRWSAETNWPAMWEERVRRASEPEGPGIFVIRAEPERYPSTLTSV